MTAGPYRAFGALRCLLAVLVAVQHFQYLLPEARRAPFHAMGLGVTAVAVFFMLSGFIVAEATTSFYRARPAAFLFNRLLRLVPPYLAALALSVLLHQWLWQQGLLRVWDFTFSVAPGDPGLILGGVTALLPWPQSAGPHVEFIPFVWSLRIELAFYLTVCLVCAAVQRAGRRLGDVRAQLLLLHLGFAGGLAGCVVLLVAGRPLLLLDIPFFLAGIAIFRLGRSRSTARWMLFAATAAAACWSLSRWPQPPGLRVDIQMLCFVMLAAIFILVARLRLPPRLRALDRRLGCLSYPLYLNHYVIGIFLYDVTTARGWPLFAAGLLLALLLATLMHRIVEAPLYGFRNKVRGATV
jgi:peptidoglycan/LPS O-acetylase OafA/YrhL